MATQSTWRSGNQAGTAPASSKWDSNANPAGIRSSAPQHVNAGKANVAGVAGNGSATVAASNQRSAGTATTTTATTTTPYANALGARSATAAGADNEGRIQADRMVYLLVGLIGNTVLANTRSGAKYVGILSATSTADKGRDTLGVVLSCAQQIMPDGEALGPLKKSLIIKGDELDGITAHEVGLDVPVSMGRGERVTNAAFGIDTDISSKTASDGPGQGTRTLQKWTGGQDTDLLLDDASSSATTGGGAWDQFAANEARFGIKSNYDEAMYTTKLDKSGADFEQRQRKADQLAREIMNATTTNTHIAEERSTEALAGGSAGQSEEDKYGAVVRGTEGAYVPPAARRAAAVAAAANANASATARMNGGAAAASETAAGADTPSIVTTAPSSAANDQKGAQHQDAVGDFRQFVSQERERAERKKAALAKKEKESTLTALKSWSDNFKLSFPGQAKNSPDAKTQEAQATSRTASHAEAVKGVSSGSASAALSPGASSGEKNAGAAAQAVRPKAGAASNAATRLAETKAMLASWKVPEIPALEESKTRKRSLVPGDVDRTSTTASASTAPPAAIPQSSSIMTLPHIPPYNKNRPAAGTSTATAVPVPGGDAKADAGASSSKAAFRMSAKASSFKPFNPNAASFTPGSSTTNNTSSRVAAEASPGVGSPAPAPVAASIPAHPFFGHRVVKKSSTAKQAGLRDDFSPFKNGRVPDAASVEPMWGFTGKSYRMLFHPIPPTSDEAGVAQHAPRGAQIGQGNAGGSGSGGGGLGMQGIPPQGLMAGQALAYPHQGQQHQHQHLHQQHQQQHMPGAHHLVGQPGGGMGMANMAAAGGQLFYMPYGAYRFPGGGAGGPQQPMQGGMAGPPYMGQPQFMGQMPFSPPMQPTGPPSGAGLYSPQMGNMMPAGVASPMPPNMGGGRQGGGGGGKGGPPGNMYYQSPGVGQPIPFLGGAGAGGPQPFHPASSGPSPLIRHQQHITAHHPAGMHQQHQHGNHPPPQGVVTPMAPSSQPGSSANATPSIASAAPASSTSSPPNGRQPPADGKQ